MWIMTENFLRAMGIYSQSIGIIQQQVSFHKSHIYPELS